MTPKAILFVGAAALLALALGIVAVQRQAKTCTVHSHAAGQAAVALAWVCVLAAIGLIAASFSL